MKGFMKELFLRLDSFFNGRYTVFKKFGYAGNGEAYQAPTSTRPLGITRSVPGLCGYQAKDYVLGHRKLRRAA